MQSFWIVMYIAKRIVLIKLKSAPSSGFGYSLDVPLLNSIAAAPPAAKNTPPTLRHPFNSQTFGTASTPAITTKIAVQTGIACAHARECVRAVLYSHVDVERRRESHWLHDTRHVRPGIKHTENVEELPAKHPGQTKPAE